MSSVLISLRCLKKTVNKYVMLLKIRWYVFQSVFRSDTKQGKSEREMLFPRNPVLSQLQESHRWERFHLLCRFEKVQT